MDFYQIGALIVFPELGHLIEEDERKKTNLQIYQLTLWKLLKIM